MKLNRLLTYLVMLIAVSFGAVIVTVDAQDGENDYDCGLKWHRSNH